MSWPAYLFLSSHKYLLHREEGEQGQIYRRNATMESGNTPPHRNWRRLTSLVLVVLLVTMGLLRGFGLSSLVTLALARGNGNGTHNNSPGLPMVINTVSIIHDSFFILIPWP